MNTWGILFPMLRADFLERTRRSSFLVTVCLVMALGYMVNTGQILIKLDDYRGIYNSAWVGSLMALVITFFLGISGFFLVKNAIDRDERSGVGQIIATTSLTRPQYLLGKWLSNFAVLSALVAILALAAILMQIIHREADQIQIWALIAPLLFIALPMMALVAAFAVFFETVPWLKGGFGNLVYFFLFFALFTAGIFLTRAPWLDVSGVSLIGSNMKAAVKVVFPDYQGSFVLDMASDIPLQTFIWPGLNWTLGLALQRLSWFIVSMGVVLSGSLFFNRFDPTRRRIARRKQDSAQNLYQQEENSAQNSGVKLNQLTPLMKTSRFHFNIARLVWLECLLLTKGLKWYWLAGMGAIWLGCAASPSENLRNLWFILACIWPVLLWSKMGEREVRYHAEQLVYQAAHPLTRLLFSSWLAGVIVTALLTSGVLVGRLVAGEPISLLPWALSAIFIPTLAITLGIWSRGSKLFEVIYPILWYLGPANHENSLVVIDFLGIHTQSPINISPLAVLEFLCLLLIAAFIGRKLQTMA